MGLFQKAVETYNCNQNLVGVSKEDNEILAPISHTLTRANIEVTVDKDGNYKSARLVDKDAPKIIIPVTEASNGRTSSLSPHPLCEQLKYLAPYNDKAYKMYLKQLKEWECSEFTHPIVKAVYSYISEGSIINDLSVSGLIKLTDKDKASEEKLLVVWRVIGLSEEIEPSSCLNKELFDSFIKYYNTKIEGNNKNICFVDGLEETLAEQHPKGVIPISGNAKLISSNDSTNFTYRGRFSEDWQAVTISYKASQKAHSALRWLIANQAFYSGGRTFLCWNPQGIKIPNPKFPFRANKEPKYKPSDYQDSLMATLLDFKKENQLKGNEIAVIAFFDAATTGRLALTYYNEITINDFLNHVVNWEKYCRWHTKFGIITPNLLNIISCAFGTLRNGKLEIDDKVQGQHMQRLLCAKLNGGNIPVDFVKALTERASMPLAFDKNVWEQITETACAVLQKYRKDINQGGNEMAWELTKPERSFQFGRLLAVLDRAEADYYGKTGEDRQTNAIKFMNEYRRRPWHVYERVNRMLHQAYLPRIENWQRIRYEKLTGEITTIISSFPENELNEPLDDLYLMGYQLQRNDFFKKLEKTETEENK